MDKIQSGFLKYLALLIFILLGLGLISLFGVITMLMYR